MSSLEIAITFQSVSLLSIRGIIPNTFTCFISPTFICFKPISITSKGSLSPFRFVNFEITLGSSNV